MKYLACVRGALFVSETIWMQAHFLDWLCVAYYMSPAVTYCYRTATDTAWLVALWKWKSSKQDFLLNVLRLSTAAYRRVCLMPGRRRLLHYSNAAFTSTSQFKSNKKNRTRPKSANILTEKNNKIHPIRLLEPAKWRRHGNLTSESVSMTTRFIIFESGPVAASDDVRSGAREF